MNVEIPDTKVDEAAKKEITKLRREVTRLSGKLAAYQAKEKDFYRKKQELDESLRKVREFVFEMADKMGLTVSDYYDDM